MVWGKEQDWHIMTEVGDFSRPNFKSPLYVVITEQV